MNGVRLSRDIHAMLTTHTEEKALAIFIVGDNPVTESFVASKQAFADGLSVRVVLERFSGDVTERELIDTITHSTADAIVVQLPLPAHIDERVVLNAIPQARDVDVLSDAAFNAFIRDETALIPPVAHAVSQLLDAYDISVPEKNIVVLGKGRLVGEPTARLLKRRGGKVAVIDSATPDDTRAQLLGAADIIVSGVGKPGILQPEMIRDGAVVIDAGTSNSTGQIVGDVAPGCRARASHVALTPGGVGPVTVAMLFSNILTK